MQTIAFPVSMEYSFASPGLYLNLKLKGTLHNILESTDDSNKKKKYFE